MRCMSAGRPGAALRTVYKKYSHSAHSKVSLLRPPDLSTGGLSPSSERAPELPAAASCCALQHPA